MKKAIHLFIATLLVITFQSCSKSANDLVPKPKSGSVDVPGTTGQSGMTGKGTMDISPNSSDLVEVYDYINEPYPLKLGRANSIIMAGSGQFAAFYVVVSDKLTGTIVNARLSSIDDAKGETINTYELMEGAKASNFNLDVPKDLTGRQFYFAIMPLSDLDDYAFTPMALRAEVQTYKEAISSQLDHAFTYSR